MIKIHLPQALNELGSRQNNEDAVFPPKGSAVAEDRLFLVCDGVGGQEKGEVASALICEHFHHYIQAKEETTEAEALLPKALGYAEKKMRSYVQDHPSSTGMASTLTCALLKPHKIILGWVGDSRIYHIRDGQILFQTKDHSHVQWLIDNGEITEAQAERHPQRNIILRAVNGSEPASMDQHVLENIRPGDFLFLCSDGILETLGKPEINHLFQISRSPEQIKQAILQRASGKTRDNFSMYLIKIKEITASETTAPIKSEKERPPTRASVQSAGPSELSENRQKRNFYWVIPGIFLLIIIALILSYWWPKEPKSSSSTSGDETEKVVPIPDESPAEGHP